MLAQRVSAAGRGTPARPVAPTRGQMSIDVGERGAVCSRISSENIIAP